jgi:hypothetical protein
MKKFRIFTAIFLFAGMSVAAQDLVILKDGNIIEAKVMEIAPSEIRYKRFNHLDGPTIIIQRESVLTIRYEKGNYEIISAITPVRQENISTNNFSGQQAGEISSILRSGISTVLVQALNTMPAVPIAGNNLKFEFSVDSWIAKVSGRDFLAGTIMSQDINDGVNLTLKQTHTYVAGRKVSTPGPDIFLEYKKGPPPSFRLVSRDEMERQQNSAQMSSTAQTISLPFEGMWGSTIERVTFDNNNFTYFIVGKSSVRGTFTYNATHIQFNITQQYISGKWVESSQASDAAFQNLDGRPLAYSFINVDGVTNLNIINISPEAKTGTGSREKITTYGLNMRKL